MSFQRNVNNNPAPAVAGDFATANPFASVVANIDGGFVAGPGGVTVGKFAWIDPDGRTVHSHGSAPNAPDGFVHRDQQALITTYLAEASMVIPAGFPVTIMRMGDFYATVFGAASSKGGAVYAQYSNGDVVFGSLPSAATVTGAIGSTNTAALGATFTASADTDDTRLVVTSVTGLISIGDEVSGTGITAGTTIESQVSGTTGGAGTYQLSASNTASAATVTAFGSVVRVSATTGRISIGDVISGGAGFPVGATVLSQISGTPGGAGDYSISAAGSAYTASATGVTTFGTVLNVTAVSSGSVDVGEPVTGTGVPSGAVVTEQLSGSAGGIGTYRLSVAASAYAASTTITAVGGVLTTWVGSSVASVGELAVITK